MATPPLSVPVPRVVLPSRKVTLPVGVPAPGATALTVAVRVTFWPVIPGLGATVRLVLVLLACTVSPRLGGRVLLAETLVSPA